MWIHRTLQNEAGQPAGVVLAGDDACPLRRYGVSRRDVAWIRQPGRQPWRGWLLVFWLLAWGLGSSSLAATDEIASPTTTRGTERATLEKSDPKSWWSFQPLSQVTPPRASRDSGMNPIDAFIDARLDAKGLKRSPSADAGTLCRRLYFDLIGLPPSPDQVDSFAAAHAADADRAVNQLVEDLLVSPHYGERWARHWLDVVHYGDTHGYDKDKPRPNAWPYRDYVIRAFNADKPYARFVQEQIAGDVMFPGSRDGIEALGFIAAGPWDFIGHAEVPETKIDGKIARHLDRDDMVANTMGTFASVTVHCAQCHAHKFDPISQEDYYSLHAVFAAVDRTDRKYYSDSEMTQRLGVLEERQRVLSRRKVVLERAAENLVGESLKTLDTRIGELAKQPRGNSGPEAGYHSEISSRDDDTKWVQVDLGRSRVVDRIVLQPCYDDFANIGAGFGFPRRYRVELSEDPEFGTRVALPGGVFEGVDGPNPGLTPQVIAAGGRVARYVRVTATRLALRSGDYIFALAELEALDVAGTNHAAGAVVVAKDSIESPVRWRKANLVDGIFPVEPKTNELAVLRKQRTEMIEAVMSPADRQELHGLTDDLARVKQELSAFPPPQVVYAGGVHYGSGNFMGTGTAGGKPRPIFLLARGQVTQPGRPVGPGALAMLGFQPARFELPETSSEGDRRVALARWLVDPANPLTWRSVVNRVWQYHFGRGLVATPNDLGRMGAEPTHPELINWLAIKFRDEGGSLKKLHRLIVTSATYRQAVSSQPAAESVDSENTLLWRQNRKKLEAEALRDAVLAVSGTLDLKPGGPGWQDFVVERPEHSPHYEYGLADPEDPRTWRRSIYRFIVRSQTQPWMTVLDCADPSMRVERRNESQSALQALALMNNGFMVTQARHFAARVQREKSGLDSQVQYAHRLAVGRWATPAELHRLSELAAVHGMAQMCRALLNLNEFAFVD